MAQNSAPPSSHSKKMLDTTIYRPNDLDILCGSGNRASAHPGNKRFQVIIHKHYTSYETASSKSAKMQVTHDVLIDIMASGCTRFLKKDSIYEMYYVAARRVGKDKVSHCLREMKAKRALQDRSRRYFPLREHLGSSTSSHSFNMIAQRKAAEECTEPTLLQDSFSFNDDFSSFLQVPSMMEDMLYGGVRTIVVPETGTTIADAIILHQPCTSKRSASRTSSSDNPPVFLTASPDVPFESISPGWLKMSSPFSSSGPCLVSQGPPDVEATCRNAQQAAIVPTVGLDSRGIFSIAFWEQEQEEQVSNNEHHQQQVHHGEDMSARDRLREQSLVPGINLTYNVLLQQEQQNVGVAHGDDEEYFFDTLKCDDRHQGRTEGEDNIARHC